MQTGFEGLDIRDTVFSQGFEVEPPDQGLCGGTFGATTFLWEEVNLAIGLFDTQQNQYTPPALGLNVLYGVPPAFDSDTGQFGPFLSDPKCYFDPDTGRWFHTVLEADVDPASGDLTGGANTLLAVSQTRDPLGPYTVYAIDASHADCTLCIGDQPLLGADANGLYISTAEYDLAPPAGSPGFFGAQIYAIDKRALASGGTPNVVHFETGHAVHRHGAARDVAQRPLRDRTVRDGVLHVRPGLRAAGLPRRSGFAREHHPRVGSHPHRDPAIRASGPQALRPNGQERGLRPAGPAAPEAGPHPLGESHNEPVPPVESNDARMNQVVFAAGRLWGGVNTIAMPGPRDGIAWFSVDPSVSSSGVRADISEQGYVAGRDRTSFVSFPSIGVNDAGQGVIAYSLMGDRYYPSAAQTGINRRGLTTGVQIVRNGFKPEDGFTCYEEEGFGPNCRWGDYSASFALPNRRHLVGDRVHRRQRQDDVRQLEHVRLAVPALTIAAAPGGLPARRHGASAAEAAESPAGATLS